MPKSLLCSAINPTRGPRIAQQRGIKTLSVPRLGRKREEHDREIVSVLRDERVDLICLAGYMRVLSPFFVDEFKNRILNIHPSLLPLFPGLDPQLQALEHGVNFSGCTVHFVDNTLDGGPIIAQRTVPVCTTTPWNHFLLEFWSRNTFVSGSRRVDPCPARRQDDDRRTACIPRQRHDRDHP